MSFPDTARFVPRLSVLMMVMMAVASGAPLPSPLALTPDPVGAELQQAFIAAPGATNTVAKGFVAYRKRFPLAAVPASATLRIFADARYMLWINGQAVHRGPNRFETRGPQYDSVEIGSVLVAGTNTIAIVVMGNVSGNGRTMNHAPGLTMRIESGGTTVVRTDSTWKCGNQTRYRPASVTWADIIDRIDSRVEDGDWTQPEYDDTAWSPAVAVSGDSWGPLAARRIPLLRDTPVAYTLNSGATLPSTLTTGQQLAFTVNGGRMVQAYTILEIDADANTQLTLGYAGGITYFTKAGRQTYISSDTHAFSGGSITVVSGRASILSMRFMERLYPFDVAGSFESSDETLNRLWTVCARSCQLFSEDAYVDCADRERVEWMDCDPPGFDITRSAMSAPGANGQPAYADGRLLGEMLRRTALTLQPDGWVKAHTCSDRFDIHAKMEDRACDWVEGARRYHDSTGDATVIREIWPVIVTQLNYFLDRRSVRGLVRGRDWVVWGNPIGYFTCEATGLNAFVYKALVDAAYLGNAIGQTSQAATFTQAATDLSNAMNSVLWDETTGSYFTAYYSAADQAASENAGKTTTLAIANEKIAPSMFAALWMLDQGVVPESRKARVTQYLLANRSQASRIMTFYYLWFQLYGQHSGSHDTEVLSTMRTKWAGMANSVAQTTWEDFTGGSQAHIYGMFPGYFLSSHVLGVRLDGLPATRKLLVEPRPGDLAYARGNVVTELGVVPVSWKRLNGGLEVTTTIPAGCTATIRVPRFETTLPPKVTLDGQNVANVVTDGRYVVIPVSAGTHTLAVSSDLIWQGDSSTNAWNMETANWRDAAGAPSAFIAGANAVFDDAGSGIPSINLTAAVQPAGVTVNAAKNYVFSGSGSLVGAMALAKSGTGMLTLASANTFTGGTLLNGGTLAIGSGDRLGSGSVDFGGGCLALSANTILSNTLRGGGTSPVHLDTQGNALTCQSEISSLAGAGGGLRKSGAGLCTLRGKLSYTGPTRIDGGTLQLAPLAWSPPVAGLLYRLDASNSASLTLAGSKVAAWADANGGPHGFTQATSTMQPTLVSNALNGLPVVRFSGGQRLVLSASTSPREVVAVTTVKGGADGNIGGFLGSNNADVGLRLNSLPNGWAIDNSKTGINGVENYVSGVSPYAPYTADVPHIVHRYQTPWSTWSATGFGQYFTGGTSRFYNGDVAEILVYGTALTAEDRMAIRNYLNAKWLGASSTVTFTTLPEGTGVDLAASGAAWDLNGATQTIASLSGVGGTSVLLGSGGLTVGDGGDTGFAGSISGTGALVKTGAGILTLSGTGALDGPVTVSEGTLRITGTFTFSNTVTIAAGASLDLLGGTLILAGPVTSHGVLRLLAGADLVSTGTFTNHGVLDMMTATQPLPANFVNHGTVFDQSAVKVNGIEIAAGAVSIRITSHTGHAYQLQAGDSLDPATWENVGEARNGTGGELVFSEGVSSTVPRKFYRIVVFP